MIHPSAVVHPGARLDPTVQIGPHAVVDEHVTLGPGCVVGPHVYLTGHTLVGANNRFHAGAVIGDSPQDLKYRQGEPSRLRIGDDNTFREHVTVHRSNTAQEETVIGSHNLLMANCHVGHNTVIGNHVIIVNNVLLAGHVEVGDRALISGQGGVHQFTRVGTLALMQGGTIVTQDVPPYCLATEFNLLCGLNVIGLRRNGFTSEQRLELKRLYRALFRGGRNLSLALADARKEFHSPAALTMMDFIASSKRGVCRHPSRATDGHDPD